MQIDITDPEDTDQSKKAKEPEQKFQPKWKEEFPWIICTVYDEGKKSIKSRYSPNPLRKTIILAVFRKVEEAVWLSGQSWGLNAEDLAGFSIKFEVGRW